jgi:RNA polymerase sigma-70 factor (ECF subfamily)
MVNPELAFGELRPLMFSVAYRMLGSITEAEDVVQEACLRMHAGAPGVLRSPEAYAVTVTARLAIDALRSARRRRERYIGPWLPDPLAGPDQADPAWRFEMDETVSVAFLVLLEKLTPVERAVFLLREVFGYPYADVADVAGKSEAACRQALHRARQHLRDSHARFVVPAAERDRLAGRFFAAVRDGDLAGLEAMLSDDVVFYGDGGGQAPAVREPVRGPARVARFVLGLARQARRLGIQLEPVQVNGQPGARALAPDGTIQAVLSLDISNSRVGAIYNQINPGKLSHLAARTPRISTPATPADQVTGGRGEGREKAG